MKTRIFLMICILFSFTICFAQNSSKELQDFALDLSSANIKLRGELMLIGKYKDNLTLLTFESYLDLLEKAETNSNKGISEIITTAEKEYFISKVYTFYVVLYIKKFNAIIYDDANTAFIDSIQVLNSKDEIPDLKSFIRK